MNTEILVVLLNNVFNQERTGVTPQHTGWETYEYFKPENDNYDVLWDILEKNWVTDFDYVNLYTLMNGLYNVAVNRQHMLAIIEFHLRLNQMFQ